MRNTKYHRLRPKGQKRIMEHRQIMQDILGRKLKRNETVHHIDGNGLNNNPNNLQLMTIGEHHRYHRNEEYSGPNGDFYRARSVRGGSKFRKIEKRLIPYISWLYRMGFLQREIANIYKVSQGTIATYLKGAKQCVTA